MSNAEQTETALEDFSGVIAAATTAASQAMQQWTGAPICLTLDSLVEVSLEEATAALGIGDDPLTMVVLQLDGTLGGQLVLAFGEEDARDLARTLAGAEDFDTPEGAELKQSALMETGNILGCAYVNAISEAADVLLVPSPPYYVHDFGSSVIEQALVEQTMCGGSALVCHTTFTCDGKRLHWNVFVLPSNELMEKLGRVQPQQS